MATKTGKVNIRVNDLCAYVNKRLRTSLNEDVDQRIELICLLEKFLLDTNNYSGFQYLDETKVSEGLTVGVRYATGKAEFENTDDTRRKYFTNN